MRRCGIKKTFYDGIKVIDILSKLDDDGLKILVSLTKVKTLFPKKPPDDGTSIACNEVRAKLIQSIGSSKMIKVLKTLNKLLESKDEKVMFATCDALACYSELPISKKRSIVERVIKRYNTVWSKDSIRYQKNNMASWRNASSLQKRKFRKFKPFDNKPFDKALRKLVGCGEDGFPFSPKANPNPAFASIDIGPELWLRMFKEHKNDKKW